MISIVKVAADQTMCGQQSMQSHGFLRWTAEQLMGRYQMGREGRHKQRTASDVVYFPVGRPGSLHGFSILCLTVSVADALAVHHPRRGGSRVP
jgi:hypothetical protein